MSWLSNLLHPEVKASTEPIQKISGAEQLYISVENTRVCFLVIDESTKPNTIVSREEFFLGPIENLEEGKPVRDLFGSLLKFLTNHKDKLENKKRNS